MAQNATPPVASGDLKTFLPERKESPAKAGGEMLRILESKTALRNPVAGEHRGFPCKIN
jgi:hypothetical protein